MVDALKRSAAGTITAIIPYYGYARQDRRPEYSRTPITSRLVAGMLESAGVDQVITLDIHSTQQQGFFTIPMINVSASKAIIADVWQVNGKHNKRLVVVSPDVGGVVRARAIAKRLDDADLAIIDKRRPGRNRSEVMNIIGDVQGRECVIMDDIVDTAGTLCQAALALKNKGAKRVVAYCTHPVLSGVALESIEASFLDEVVVTDTIPLTPQAQNCGKIRQLGLSKLLAETIRRVSNKGSVSSMFPERKYMR